ncbi:PRC-barrel domain-containing protein [Streptomyces sp. NPDC047046]|uniref:PRC-barrel domain-containing protein n=1 Tax=Streptomyces sp. NPDC047046 TaxID=3155378 RepID=UPI0034063548
MTDSNLWNYGPEVTNYADAEIVGYKVEARDGHIGKVDKHSTDVDSQYIVVDTGVWIFGKEVLLPAGTLTGIDHENKTVTVSRTKDEIKSAPEFDKDKHLADPGYRTELGSHYTRGGAV